MAEEVPLEKIIEKILQAIHNEDPKVVAEELGKLEISSERLTKVLRGIAVNDHDESVRQAARKALLAPIHQPFISKDEPKVYRDFLIGFGGWFVISGLMYICISLVARPVIDLLFFCTFPLIYLANVGILIRLGFTRGWIALG